MDTLQTAEQLRHHGLELIKLAADLEAEHRAPAKPPAVTPGYVCDRCNEEAGRLIECSSQDGLRVRRVCPRCADEIIPTIGRDGLGRLRCCGAGPDQRDARTGEDLHMPFCHTLTGSPVAR